MTRITIDFLGPITQSNNFKYVLIVTDSCTRYSFAVPCREADAKTVAQKLLDLSYSYGFPKVITHDRGTHFINKTLAEMATSLGITQRPSPAYAPQIQGQSERFNQILTKAISHYVEIEPRHWSKYIAPIVFCYNTSVNASTGYTPFYLMFGYEATTPADYKYILKDTEKNLLDNIHVLNRVRDEMPQIMKKAQDRQKYYFDKKRQDLQLGPGDEILIYTPVNHAKPYSKFKPKYSGPYMVERKLNDQTYEIQKYNRGRLITEPIHVSRIKLFNKRITE